MRLFICGFGTIGKGFSEIIAARQEFFQNRYGRDVKIVGAMDSKSYVVDQNGLDPLRLVADKESTGSVGSNKYTDSTQVLDSVEFDVLIEVSPTDVQTGGAGLKNVTYALEHGKDVISVNKGPLALKFKELMTLAKKNGCMYRYEGSVAGAMPIINLCTQDLAGENIKSIKGIFNGTCNYILSKMDNGQPFDQALKEAQQLGYAETDSTNDIEGFDSACKVVILANAIFGRDVTFNDVDITGISSITAEAISLAESKNMVIRLIGEVSKTKLEVKPRLVPKGHALSISGTLNAAEISTDLAGTISVSGRGAGRIETGSAILSDLVAIMDARSGE